MQFSDIQNKVIEPKVIELLGEKVEVKQYLPMQDKMNILEMVIQTADAGTILNTLVLDAVFDTYLVYKYTDIVFTEEEKENILDTYDKMEKEGIIEAIIKEIPEQEYKILYNNLTQMITDYKTYRSSAKAIIDSLALFAPSAEKLNDAIANIDGEKVNNLITLFSETNAPK